MEDKNLKATLIFRGGCKLQNMGSDNKNRIPDGDLSEIASTLLSRDYKGLGNFNCNGVIEIWKLNI